MKWSGFLMLFLALLLLNAGNPPLAQLGAFIFSALSGAGAVLVYQYFGGGE